MVGGGVKPLRVHVCTVIQYVTAREARLKGELWRPVVPMYIRSVSGAGWLFHKHNRHTKGVCAKMLAAAGGDDARWLKARNDRRRQRGGARRRSTYRRRSKEWRCG